MRALLLLDPVAAVIPFPTMEQHDEICQLSITTPYVLSNLGMVELYLRESPIQVDVLVRAGEKASSLRMHLKTMQISGPTFFLYKQQLTVSVHRLHLESVRVEIIRVLGLVYGNDSGVIVTEEKKAYKSPGPVPFVRTEQFFAVCEPAD